MRRFTRLYSELDESNRTKEKVAALVRYFSEAPAKDAVWALALMTGRRPGRAVNSTQLRQWVAEESGYPDWLVEESYDVVGDLAETIALLLPERDAPVETPLHELMERTLALKSMEEPERKEEVLRFWREFGSRERFVWHKLTMGGFRVGVSRTLVSRALAEVAGIPAAEMEHRLMGEWEPTEEDYRRILSGQSSEGDITRPYPFFLAYALEEEPSSLGEISEWQLEWKWDGIRAQLIHRRGELLLWSRGEELVTDRYPEITAAGRMLPRDVVIDGELLAWKDGAPLPFSLLQKRIGRKSVGKKLLKEAPVALIAYDLLEIDGEDFRQQTLADRRAALESVVGELKGLPIFLSERVHCDSWKEAAELRGESRGRGVEGFMIKRKRSPYRTGRVKGDWWKWKIEPYTIDAVMVYAQRGHGRRAGLYTDYTFSVWDGRELTPIAKAYSGLTDTEIRKVDHWIKRNTLDRHGPVRVVKPELVFEIAFEGIQESPRHKSGLSVRFPRISRWRTDKSADEADTLETMRSLLEGE